MRNIGFVFTLGLALWLAATGDSRAQRQLTQFPQASLPYNGSEVFYCAQNGVTSQCKNGTLVPTFATMALMQASANLTGTVYLSGSNSFNDGGQGYFTVSASSCTVDSGNCVQNASGQYLVRNTNGNANQPGWFGAVPGADISPLLVNTMWPLGVVRVPAGRTYQITGAGVPSNQVKMTASSALVGDSPMNSFITMTSVPVLWMANQTTIADMNFSGVGNTNGMLFTSGAGPLVQARVQDNLINNSNGPCAQFNIGFADVGFFGNTLTCSGYGFLQNLVTTGNGGSGLRFNNNFVSTTGADALELNTPGSADVKRVAATGNVLDSTSTNVNAKFGLGCAACQGVAFTGNFAHAQGQAIHIEDNHRDVTVTGNALQGGENGAVIQFSQRPSGSNTSYGEIVSSNHIRWDGVGTANACVWRIKDGFGSVGRNVVDDNKCYSFPLGFFFDGPGTDVVANNVVSDATIGIESLNGSTPASPARLVGTNVFHGIGVGAYVNGGETVGKMIYEDACPPQLMQKSGTVVPGAVLEGFACPIASVTVSGAGSVAVPLVPLANLMRGTLRVHVGTGGASNGVMRQADITWNGTTLTEVAGTILDDDEGAFTGAAFTAAAAQTGSFTGVISGSTLTSSGLVGTLKIGQVVSGTGVPVGETIVSGSGTSWGLSVAATVASEAMTSTDGGMLTANFSSSGAVSSVSAYVDFTGTYYQK